MRIPLGAIILSSIVVVGGCSNDGLRKLYSTGQGPEEFGVMPVKPLTEPGDYTKLPTPTPGGSNLVDTDPRSDAILALGGRAASGSQGVSSGDGALVSHAGRYGVPSDTREVLAESDAEFRKRKSRGFLSRLKLGRVDRYREAYSAESLEPYSETQRFRRGGAATPSSPPSR